MARSVTPGKCGCDAFTLGIRRGGLLLGENLPFAHATQHTARLPLSTALMRAISGPLMRRCAARLRPSLGSSLAVLAGDMGPATVRHRDPMLGPPTIAGHSHGVRRHLDLGEDHFVDGKRKFSPIEHSTYPRLQACSIDSCPHTECPGRRVRWGRLDVENRSFKACYEPEIFT